MTTVEFNLTTDMSMYNSVCSDLLRVELVKLCLQSIPPPQTQHFGLGTVCHIDQLLIPPSFIHCPNVTA